MKDLKTLDYATLIDKLSYYTTEYVRLLKVRDIGEEFHHCKACMNEIMAEIEIRKKETAAKDKK